MLQLIHDEAPPFSSGAAGLLALRLLVVQGGRHGSEDRLQLLAVRVQQLPSVMRRKSRG